ncbi:MAG: serine/threonine protein kinase [Clostridiales bacterium]|nr:serine/threonine protein kinase [Clostridiales bacterium]
MNYKRLFVLLLTLIMLLSSYGCKGEATDNNELTSNQAEPVVEISISNTYTSTDEDIIHEKHLVEQSGWIYYHNPNDRSKLYKRSMDGSKNIKILDDYLGSYCLDGEWIYYSNTADNSSLYRVKIDGSAKEKLNNVESSSINVSKEWVYYINSSDNGRIYKIKKDGSEGTKIGDDTVWSIYAGGGDWIYYCNTSNNNYIYSIGMDGKERTKITNSFSYNLCVSEDWVYYEAVETKEADYPRVFKIKRDGTEETLLTHLGETDMLYRLEVSGDYIYISNEALYRIKKDGTDFTKLSSENEHVGIFNVTEDSILFLSTFYNDYISKMNLKSKNETLVDKLPGFDSKHLAEWIIYNDKQNDLGLTIIGNDKKDYNVLLDRITSKLMVLENTAYFLVQTGEYNNLYKLDINNPEPKLIAEGNIVTYDIGGGFIYYYDSSDHTLYNIKTDGTEKNQVSKKRAEYIQINGEWIYFGFMSSEINRMKVDGTEEQKLTSCSGSNSPFKIFNGWIYFSDEMGLSKIKLDGTEKTRLYEDIHGIGSILSINYGRIFYETMIAEGGGYYNWINGLYSIKLDGTDKQTLLEATYNSWVIDGASVYYSKIVRDINIMKIKLDGTDRKVIMPNLEWH